jgi:hypothetical protein
MDRLQPSPAPTAKAQQGRSFAKCIAELAMFLELSEPDAPTPVEAAAAEFAADRNVPASTMKRCASEARALIEHAHATGALKRIAARANGAEWRLQHELSAWVDEVSLPEILRERALRLNRSRGGRPPTRTRTLRAVEELVRFARAGRPDALDELRSIRALVSAD